MKKFFLYTSLLLPFILLALFFQVNKVEPLESFSLRFNDVNFELQEKKPNENIVFVAIDEQSVNNFGRWPWRREILAHGLDKLQEADIVLMDMIFSESTDPKADTILADSISNLNASICGFFLRQKSTQIMTDEEHTILDDSTLDLLQSQISKYNNPLFVSAPHAEINILPVLESCTLSGSFSTLAESDKLLRSYPISLYFNDKLFPSLAVQALRVAFNSEISRLSSNEVQLNDKVIALNDKGFVRLNFYKKEQYNIVSFLDLINGKINPSYFKDKIVILGITEIGSGDVVSTPVGFLYGPLLHYTFISNFLQDHLIIEPRYTSSILMVLLMVLPFILLFLINKVFYRSIINFSVYVLTYILVRYLFISEMLYIDLFYPLLGLLTSAIVIEAIAFSQQEKSNRFIKDAFSAYLSEELLEQLIENPKTLSLGGENKRLTILFSDIRGFTNISESMNAHDLVHLLNRYFTPMTDSVLEHKGMLDKYIGDAIMAFFNAPVDVELHADKAALTALDMIERLNSLNKALEKENIPSIKIGIGINTADVVVGNMGSNSRFNYTVMGDGVNLASRVESLTKNYGIDILITEFTAKELSSSFVYRKIEDVIVKGKEKAVTLYELMPSTDKSREIKKLYEEALEYYIQGEPKKATSHFNEITNNFNDAPSQYFLEKIKKNEKWNTLKMATK